MYRLVAIFASLILFGACAGTGTTSYSLIAPELSTSEKGKIFVFRESEYIGGGALVDVTINGVLAGKLGSGEMLFAKANTGTNIIEVKIDGWQGIGLNTPMLQIENNEKENKFFVIGFKTGLLMNELNLIETTESGWKSQLK